MIWSLVLVFSVLGIIFTVLKVRVWRETPKAINTGRKETLANCISLRERKMNNWVRTVDSKVDIKFAVSDSFWCGG